MASMSKAKAEPRALPKRFYKDIAVQQDAAAFFILLDGKPIRTPAKKMLQVSVQQLADAIAAEWAAQTDMIDTDTMPLTRLANIMLDRTAADREALLAEMVGYAETDLVCYRAPVSSSPRRGEVRRGPEYGDLSSKKRPPLGLPPTREEDLRLRQDAAFDPILAWAKQKLGIVLWVTDGVMPIAQSAASIHAVKAQFERASDAELAALSMLLPILGSALLTLAVWKGRLDIDAALVASRLDEAYQAERWGEDSETRRSWANKCRDARAAALFLDLQAVKSS